MQIRLFGICETEISTNKRGTASPSSTFTHHRINLIDIVHSAIETPITAPDGSWPFHFLIPEFTDTPGKYGPLRTPRNFAIQRHRLPPSFLQSDSAGNRAHISYGIEATIFRNSRNLQPHISWHELKLDTFKEQQEVPLATKHDQKLVVRRMPGLRENLTLPEKIRGIFSFQSRLHTPRLRLAPSISLPTQVIPGRELPFTILVAPKPKGPADPSGPQVTLNNLKIVLREKTSILDATIRFFRLPRRPGHSIDLVKRQITIENRRIETSSPLVLKQELTREATQSSFKKPYDVDYSLLPNIKTFTVSTTHDIAVQADLTCEGHKFHLALTVPIVVLQKRSLGLELDLEPDSGPSFPNTPPSSFCSSCPACRQAAARRAASALLPLATLQRIMEWSQESLVTDQLPTMTRPSMEGMSTIRRSHRDGSREALLPISETTPTDRALELPRRRRSWVETPPRRFNSTP